MHRVGEKIKTAQRRFFLVGAPGIELLVTQHLLQKVLGHCALRTYGSQRSLRSLLSSMGEHPVPPTPPLVRIPALRQKNTQGCFSCLSERRDSNPESLGPKPRMLAVTPRSDIKRVPLHDTGVF